MQLTLGPNGNNSLRVDGKCKQNHTNLIIPNRKNLFKEIKDIIFIIKEHSQYSINHPDNTDNILRHLKHTCHAIDNSLVSERPMPAGEESLIFLLSKISDPDEKYIDIYKKIKIVSNNSKDICHKYLYSWESKNELLETARYINTNFSEIYNEFSSK